jgi:hypothetical protein
MRSALSRQLLFPFDSPLVILPVANHPLPAAIVLKSRRIGGLKEAAMKEQGDGFLCSEDGPPRWPYSLFSVSVRVTLYGPTDGL